MIMPESTRKEKLSWCCAMSLRLKMKKARSNSGPAIQTTQPFGPKSIMLVIMGHWE